MTFRTTLLCVCTVLISCTSPSEQSSDGVRHWKSRRATDPTSRSSLSGDRFYHWDEPKTRELWIGTHNGRPALRARDTLDDGTLSWEEISYYKPGDEFMIYPTERYLLLPEDERDLVTLCLYVADPLPPEPDASIQTADIPVADLPDRELPWELRSEDAKRTRETWEELVQRGMAKEVDPVLSGTKTLRVEEYGTVELDDGSFTIDRAVTQGYSLYTFDEESFFLRQLDWFGPDRNGVDTLYERGEFFIDETLPQEQAATLFDPAEYGLTDVWSWLPVTYEDVTQGKAKAGCYRDGKWIASEELDLLNRGDAVWSRILTLSVERQATDEAEEEEALPLEE